ncbi:MAG: formate dehydrogenase subunit alpha [Actinomycetota bacterium]
MAKRLKKITVAIDGVEFKVNQGLPILEAASKAGVEIPHLCAHPNLKPTGACRLCLVELEGEGSRPLIAACARPVEQGMRIITDSERILKARRTVLELLVSDHPLDCLTCELTGSCALQNYAYEYGITNSEYGGRQQQHEIDNDNPFITRDFEKCIKCYRCAQACQEIQYCYVIDYLNRGFDTMVTSANNQPLPLTDCVFCGRCVSVCPTGALTEKTSVGRGRSKDLKKTHTICPYCGVGCSIILETDGKKIIRVSSNEDAPVNKGSLCVKGRFGLDFVNSEDRLKTPLIRRDGKLVPASWDEAISTVVSRLKQTKKEYRADSIGFLSSSKCTNEENYLLQKFARAGVGTNNVDNCARLCHSPTVAGLAAAFGSGAMTNSIEDISEAEVILVIGSNTTETHPILALNIISAVKNRGVKLIVMEPRRIPLVKYTDIWLTQKPGTDVALINGLMHVILEEGLVDEAFVAEKTEDFDEVRKTIGKYNPEYVEKITGVPAADIRRAALLFGAAETASIIYAMGITQHTTGVDNVMSLANLAMMTGNIGKEGSGVNPLRGQNNVQGACDVGALPDVFPGYQKVTDEKARQAFEVLWGRKLPKKPGLTATEMIDACLLKDEERKKHKMRLMYIMGENPVLSDPDSAHTVSALKNLDFLIVQDIFLTETAALADVVLPAASFAEKNGTFTNTERRVQPIRHALIPPGDALPDWKIICRVASKFGYRMECASTTAIFDEIAAVTPQYRGISHHRIESCSIHWPCPTPDHPGTPILHKGGFARGMGKFHAVDYRPPAESPDKKYPLILTTGRYLAQFHTGTMSRKVAGLEEIAPEARVEISPEDARKYKIWDKAMISVTTRRGTVNARALVTRDIIPGVIYMPFHYAEAAANRLTNAALDPVAKIPELKVAAASIKPS